MTHIDDTNQTWPRTPLILLGLEWFGFGSVTSVLLPMQQLRPQPLPLSIGAQASQECPEKSTNIIANMITTNHGRSMWMRMGFKLMVLLLNSQLHCTFIDSKFTSPTEIIYELTIKKKKKKRTSPNPATHPINLQLHQQLPSPQCRWLHPALVPNVSAAASR